MQQFLDGKVTLHRGDSLEVLPLLDEDSVESVVCDPPYHLTNTPIGTPKKPKGGFMGKQWDGGDIAFQPDTWALVLRVLKPGGHLLAFSGTRTYHRMACAIEDAGFEIRDQIGWCYGSGFPKSHDVSKGIDRLAGAERDKITTGKPVKRIISGADQNKHGWEKNNGREYIPGVEIPATEAATQWQGWGTALKPAWEPIVLARKPLSESSIAANVLKHGTGGINVDGCRIKGNVPKPGNINPTNLSGSNGIYGIDKRASRQAEWEPASSGRWPANLIHDGSDEVLAGFPETGGPHHNGTVKRGGDRFGGTEGDDRIASAPTDSGSAARFFYTAKADADDKLGSNHPTVKPLDLMQYLVRLVTPKAGVVLDPFAGTGTTGEAAFREGMRAVLIEREPEYQANIVKRMELCLSGPDARRAAGVKQLPCDGLPLFGDMV